LLFTSLQEKKGKRGEPLSRRKGRKNRLAGGKGRRATVPLPSQRGGKKASIGHHESVSGRGGRTIRPGKGKGGRGGEVLLFLSGEKGRKREKGGN